MRTITLIIVHCSANKAGSTLRMADIDRYHRSLGWKGCGYHYVIPTDGTIERGRPEEQIGAHCRNHNRHSIGVAYIGGGCVKTPNINKKNSLYVLMWMYNEFFLFILGVLTRPPINFCPFRACCLGF